MDTSESASVQAAVLTTRATLPTGYLVGKSTRYICPVSDAVRTSSAARWPAAVSL